MGPQALLGEAGMVPQFGLLEKQEHLRFLLLHRTRSLTKKKCPPFERSRFIHCIRPTENPQMH